MCFLYKTITLSMCYMKYIVHMVLHFAAHVFWKGSCEWIQSDIILAFIQSGQLPPMGSLLWSTFQHKNGPIDPASETQSECPNASRDSMFPTLYLLKTQWVWENWIYRQLLIWLYSYFMLIHDGPLNKNASLWWVSHLMRCNRFEWRSLTWTVFVHPEFWNMYNLSKKTTAIRGIENIINHFTQHAVFNKRDLGLWSVKCTFIETHWNRKTLL